MNDSITPMQENDASLRNEIRQLRMLLVWTLVVLCVTVLSLDLYLSRQLISVNKDAAATRQVIANYQNVEGPRIQVAVAAMQAYARTNQEFRAILEKYGAAGTPSGATPTRPVGK